MYLYVPLCTSMYLYVPLCTSMDLYGPLCTPHNTVTDIGLRVSIRTVSPSVSSIKHVFIPLAERDARMGPQSQNRANRHSHAAIVDLERYPI